MKCWKRAYVPSYWPYLEFFSKFCPCREGEKVTFLSEDSQIFEPEKIENGADFTVQQKTGPIVVKKFIFCCLSTRCEIGNQNTSQSNLKFSIGLWKKQFPQEALRISQPRHWSKKIVITLTGYFTSINVLWVYFPVNAWIRYIYSIQIIQFIFFLLLFSIILLTTSKQIK